MKFCDEISEEKENKLENFFFYTEEQQKFVTSHSTQQENESANLLRN